MEGVSCGGSEFLWSRAAAQLLDQGNAVACSTRRWPVTPDHVADLQRRGCVTYFRTVPRPLNLRILGQFGLSKYIDWHWLRSFNPDIVVISLGIHLEGIEPSAFCRSIGIPYVLVIQSADEHRWPGDDYLDMLREAYIGATTCFFVSQANRMLVETMLACQLPNAQVIFNPFNVCYNANLGWPIDDGIIRMACVGALNPVAKGQDLIFRVLALPEWRFRPVQISLYGRGHNARSILALAKMLRIDDRIHICGFTNNIEAIWTNHHVLLLPSRHEGMPLAVVEAMLCARVCILTDVAGNAEFVTDEDSGFLAAAPTVPLLAEAMERAWVRRIDWPSIGQRAARAVRERIPQDPVGSFVRELERCAGKSL